MQDYSNMKNKVEIPKGRFWVFTINNYTDANVESIRRIETGRDKTVRGIQCQGEKKGKKGTKHLQGFIIFNNQVRMKTVKTTMECEKAHVEIMKTTEKANLNYTSKTKTYDEEADIFIRNGVFDTVSGERSDIKKITEKLDEGIPLCEAIGDDAPTFVRNHAGLEKYAIMKKKIDKDLHDEYKEIKNYEWQEELYTKLRGNPDNRKIIWIFETVGNIGKSTFMNKYSIENEKDCYVINDIGRVGDATDGLRNWMLTGKKPRTIMIDLARTREEMISIYTFIENLKNGLITCTKYKGEIMRFKSPHIVIFSNWAPEIQIKIGEKHKDSLSRDRWDIHTVNDMKLKKLTVEEVLKMKSENGTENEEKEAEEENEIQEGTEADIINMKQETIKKQAERIKQLEEQVRILTERLKQPIKYEQSTIKVRTKAKPKK